MNDILNRATVLVLNRNWQAINVRTPQDAFCQMATGVATALEIDTGDGARAEALRPVTWDEWITLPVRSQDSAVLTMRGPIRVPAVIVALNYAKVPKKRPKLCARKKATLTTSCPVRAAARMRGKTASGRASRSTPRRGTACRTRLA